nr:unnamed protein product [Digitaria exilis]
MSEAKLYEHPSHISLPTAAEQNPGAKAKNAPDVAGHCRAPEPCASHANMPCHCSDEHAAPCEPRHKLRRRPGCLSAACLLVPFPGGMRNKIKGSL